MAGENKKYITLGKGEVGVGMEGKTVDVGEMGVEQEENKLGGRKERWRSVRYLFCYVFIK